MVLNRKVTGKAMSFPAGLAFGTMVSILTTLFLAAVLSWLTVSEILEESHLGYGIMVVLLSASFVGAKGALGKIKRQRFVVCLLSGAMYFVILTSLTVLFFGGKFEAVGISSLLILCGSVVAGLAGGQTKRRSTKKIRMRNR